MPNRYTVTIKVKARTGTGIKERVFVVFLIKESLEPTRKSLEDLSWNSKSEDF